MGYVDRVAVKVWPDTRAFDRDMRRETQKRRKTVIRAVLDATQARAELKKLQKSRTGIDLDVRTAKAREKLAALRKQLEDAAGRVKQLNDVDLRQARTRLAELRADLAAATDKDARIQIRADIRDAREKLARLRADLAKARDYKVEVQADTTAARKELDSLEKDRDVIYQAQVDSLNARRELIMLARRRVAEILVWVNKTKAMKDIRAILSGLSGLNMLRRWRDAFVRTFENLPQTAIKIAALGSALATVGLPLLSMLSSLGPIGAGLRAILPSTLALSAAIGAAGVSVGILIASFGSLSKVTSGPGKRFYDNWVRIRKELTRMRPMVRDRFFGSTFTASFRELAQVILPQMRKHLGVVAEDLGHLLGGVADGMRKVLKNGGLGEFLDNLALAFRVARDGAHGFAEGFTRLLVEGSPALIDMAAKITEWGERFNKWTKSRDIHQMISDATEEFGHLWRAVKNFGGIVSGIFASMQSDEHTGLEQFADTLGEIRDIVESSEFKQAMRNIFDGVRDGAAALKDAITGPVADALLVLSPLIGNILSVLGKTAGALLTGIFTALRRPGAQDGLRKMFDAIQKMVEDIDWESIGDAFGELAGAVAEIAPLVTEIINKLMPKMPEVLRSVKDDLIPALRELVKELLPPLANLIKEMVPGITNLGDTISTLTGPIGSLANLLVGILGPAARFTDVMWDAFNALARGDWDGAGQRVRDALAGMLPPGLIPSWDEMKRGIGAKVAEIGALVAGIPGKIRAAFAGLGGLLFNAGKSIMSGLLAGLRAAWESVKSFVGGIADWIRRNKGPLTFDYGLLQPAGRMMMKGLRDSMAVGMRGVQRLVSSFAPTISATLTAKDGGPPTAALGGPHMTMTVHTVNPVGEPTSRTVNRALQHAAALGFA